MTKETVVFASKAVVGEKYLTKRGMPVQVVGIEDKEVAVRSLANGGNIVKIEHSAILRPYSEEGINKDAKMIAKALAKKPHKTEGVSKRIADLDGRKQITTEYKEKKYTVEIKSDGLYIGSKRYGSLSAAAAGVTGHPTSGRYFWGLK